MASRGTRRIEKFDGFAEIKGTNKERAGEKLRKSEISFVSARPKIFFVPLFDLNFHKYAYLWCRVGEHCSPRININMRLLKLYAREALIKIRFAEIQRF